ncbi:hypothetical protein BT96DRAFT_320315 [Gymnopus androsaceus JB14]|uniref:DUF6534 domain-containing protein n=1 Tax=Gymnopus androsaceus JB14 TaxID=1447944 RepID=A0A6A4GYX3_9AGAR|nr:hypothetical protein BT96DRAFT_320315 [Gymnopus androsaceus JB14]
MVRVFAMEYVHRTREDEIALGMTLLGLLFSSILYGVALSQVYTYYKRFPRDSYSVKILVVATLILDTTSVVFECLACWYYLVTTGPMSWAVWSLNAELAVSMLISGIAEAFMIYRVWMLSSRKNILTCILLLFALLHFTSGEVSAAQFLELKRFAEFGSVEIASILRLSSACVCDTGIAVSLCYFLQQKRTGYKRTDEIIDHLIIFSINSGLITSVASIACLVTYITIPKTWVYFTLCFLITRLYSNTFLCALNSRQILQNGENDMDTPVLPRFSSISRGLGRRTSEKITNLSRPTQIDISVSKETVTTSEIMVHSSSRVNLIFVLAVNLTSICL